MVSGNTTIKAKAFKASWTASAVYSIIAAPANFVLVEGGTFNNGTSDVTISSFYLDKYELTQSDYQAIMGSNPASGYGVGVNYPVYFVNWYSTLKFCNLKSIADGLIPVYSISGSTNPSTWGTVPTSNNATWDAVICNWSANGYRLLTEAEWEYAARGATNTPDYLYSGSDDIYSVAWYSDNSSSTSHLVGTKAANALGIFDMSGNVWEWCWDWYGAYSSSPANNPTGASSGSIRVKRDGFWNISAILSRVALRGHDNPCGSYGGYDVGFRLCRAGL